MSRVYERRNVGGNCGDTYGLLVAMVKENQFNENDYFNYAHGRYPYQCGDIDDSNENDGNYRGCFNICYSRFMTEIMIITLPINRYSFSYDSYDYCCYCDR